MDWSVIYSRNLFVGQHLIEHIFQLDIPPVKETNNTLLASTGIHFLKFLIHNWCQYSFWLLLSWLVEHSEPPLKFPILVAITNLLDIDLCESSQSILCINCLSNQFISFDSGHNRGRFPCNGDSWPLLDSWDFSFWDSWHWFCWKLIL